MIYLTKSGNVAKPICDENISSIELYKNCVETSNDIFNTTVPPWIKFPGSLTSEKFYLLDENYVFHYVKPKDGLIKFNMTSTFGMGLDPNFEYFVEFHDRNFMLQTSNPDIVPKDILIIRKKVYTVIYLKVNW